MPAKNLQRVSGEGTYSHIHNKGVENRIIFNDTQDYEVFISYLKEYLSARQDAQSLKTSFTINGRTYRGTPHQPKNYFNAIELITYRLMPDSFHLILHQRASNAQALFLRSLLTRYSMYFNKKYKRSGPLFDGPYKSKSIDGLSRLPQAVRDIYAIRTNDRLSEKFAWVKPGVIPEHIEPEYKVTKTMPASPKVESKPKKLQFFATSLIVFSLLFAIGIMNVNISSANTTNSVNTVNSIASIPSPSPSPEPLVFSGAPIPSPSIVPVVAGVDDENLEPKTMLVIRIGDGSKSVNLRLEPSSYSQKVGEAKEGDTFVLVSQASGWYQVNLDDGTAYVSAKYAKIEGKQN